MTRKYLILGASSDFALEFLKTKDFQPEEEAVLQAVIKPIAKAEQGRIIFIIIICSKAVPPKLLSAYVTGKYALLGADKALTSEYAPKHIQVNMISLSMMKTKLTYTRFARHLK